MDSSFDVFIIGAGVAGLAAAEAAAQRGLSVALAEELMFGGLATNVNHLDPAPPGLPGSGSDLAAELMTRASDLGVTTLFEGVSALAPRDGMFELTTAGDTYRARAVIVASGARKRALGVPGEREFENRGVSHCADCDAPMFQSQDVLVVGGGDSALQEALVLAQFSPRVTLVHRGPQFSARPDFVQAVQSTPAITVRFGSVVEAIEGAEAVSGVRVRTLATGASELVPCKGFFAYIGLDPNTQWLPPEVERTGGAVRVDGNLQSSLPGVYAVGAARSGYGGLLSHAVEDAAVAVAAACRGRARG